MAMKMSKSEKWREAMEKSTMPSRQARADSKTPIRIVLVDDNRILREGLARMFRDEEGMRVIAEADDGIDIVGKIRELNPDVVIVEPGLSSGKGISTTKEILAQSPGTKILALSMSADKVSVLELIRAGFSGYLTKDCSFHELTSAIRTVNSGHTYLSSKITGLVVEDYIRRLSGPSPSSSLALTVREQEVLRLIAEGKRTREIAESLDVSPKTVEAHRSHLMEKLRLPGIAALVKYAVREGLTAL
jgi:DNA-binding NarL/FixJ family response regulator